MEVQPAWQSSFIEYRAPPQVFMDGILRPLIDDKLLPTRKQTLGKFLVICKELPIKADQQGKTRDPFFQDWNAIIPRRKAWKKLYQSFKKHSRL